MSNLESQMDFLNERYGVLSASYTALRDKFAKYQLHSSVGPQLSSLQKVSDSPHWNIPRNSPQAAEPGSSLVRMISFDSQRQFEFKGPSDPRRIFSNAIRGEQSKRVETESPSNFTKENKSVCQERNRRKINPSIKSEISRPSSEGEGLAAMADAASMKSRDPFQQPSPTASRSSLADLLYAACFNPAEIVHHPTHSVMKSR